MPYGSGVTPMRADTKRVLLVKRLTAIQTALGGAAHAANNAGRNDTIWRLREKIVRAKAGL